MKKVIHLNGKKLTTATTTTTATTIIIIIIITLNAGILVINCLTMLRKHMRRVLEENLICERRM